MNVKRKGTAREHASQRLLETAGPLEREALDVFRVPANGRKLMHRWRDGPQVPDVVELP